MNILEKIIEDKKVEVATNKELIPVKLLEKSTFFTAAPVSLEQYLRREDKLGVIAEFKRKSPSKGMINPYAKIEEISVGYMQAGASAISVLTDEKYFGGSKKDLELTRKLNYCPILRKDFIISEYQIIEARAMGADAILLIAAVLNKDEIKNLAQLAISLGLDVLLEIHSEEEIQKIDPDITLIGVNNRDLKTFSVNLEQSIELANKLPEGTLKIAESGISTAEDMVLLSNQGFGGFLIGEAFMKTNNPVDACRSLLREFDQLKSLEHVY